MMNVFNPRYWPGGITTNLKSVLSHERNESRKILMKTERHATAGRVPNQKMAT